MTCSDNKIAAISKKCTNYTVCANRLHKDVVSLQREMKKGTLLNY